MTYARVQRASPLFVGLLVLAAVLAAVAFVLPVAWMLSLAALGAALLTLPSTIRGAQAEPRTTSSARTGAASYTLAREQRRLTLPDGSERVGIVVPLEQDHVWELVLTREGYVLVDQSGRVRHSLTSR